MFLPLHCPRSLKNAAPGRTFVTSTKLFPEVAIPFVNGVQTPPPATALLVSSVKLVADAGHEKIARFVAIPI
jgi:hypothetical protein